MSERIEALARVLDEALQGRGTRVAAVPGELTCEVQTGALAAVARALRDTPGLQFDMLIDVTAVDYREYREDQWSTHSATGTGFSRGRTPVEVAAEEPPEPAPVGGARFAVVYHLLSVARNHRLRLKVACADEEEPTVDSVVEVWASANWFEREVFDLFGIMFRGHPDLRRILTDYGFVGHPFRKDFPLIGNVEVRYDEDRRRVVYQPVSIEPRVLVPKVIRD
ncbi:MAG TPA: NADH-quinone oxidoreductase subunit C, partial [Steroidobacteraceae bacterium]|nr:NADH-quinone oxidoreductase subunit C [Steroidobacteraceae bacterium]